MQGLSPVDHCHRNALQGASSKRRGEAERLFPFSELNLSGLVLVHTGESVLSELAFVPGKKKKNVTTNPNLKRRRGERNIL